jgi:hypothetical protein
MRNAPKKFRITRAVTSLSPDDIKIAQILVKTDDDNEPAPENRPHTSESQQDMVFGEWWHPGACF